MKKTVITPDQFKIMPWKNNAGVTAEIDIHPHAAQMADNDFEWRLSSAHIEDENKFSQFPGYDRLLTVLSGEGLILNGEELPPFSVFSFKGEEEINCSLIEGPVEDLGIIYRRDKYAASIQIIEIKDEQEVYFGSGVHFVMALAHPILVDDTEIEAPTFLKIEDAEKVKIQSENYPSYVLKISIEQKHLLQ